MKIIRNLCFALKEIKKTSKAIFPLMLLIAIMESSIVLIDLFLLKWIIDYVLTENFVISKLFLFLLIYFCVVIFFYVFVDLFRNLNIQKFEVKIMARVKEELYQKMESIDMTDFCNSQFYDKLDRALKNIGVQYFKVLIYLFVLLIRILTLLAVATYYRDVIIFIASLINVVNYIVYYFIVEKFKYDFDKREEGYYRSHDYLNRVFFLREYAQELRLMDGLEEKLISRDNDNTLKYMKRFDLLLRKFWGNAILMNSISNLIFGIMSIYVSGKLFNKTISVGEFLVAINVVTCMSTQIIDVIKVIPMVYHSGLWIGDIREVLDYSSAFKENEDGISLGTFENLELNNVSFWYDTGAKFSIHNLNLSFSKNEMIAVVGLNGSGKSTLMDIILCLIKPQNGKIYLNGIPYEEYNLNSIRNLFSVVFQDFQVYEISIAENILMHEIRSEEDSYMVEEALKFVGLYEKVMAMEEGIHTVIGQEGNRVSFSGGEQQKIAIARAYVNPSPILLFDEPTSALDVFAAEEFYDDLFKMKQQQNRTVIYTTHKLKYTVHADKIFYIKEGTISESGTHQELMKLDKEYASLYRLE